MKRSPMNRQSPKKAAEQAQRRELVEALQRAGLWECQIGQVFARIPTDLMQHEWRHKFAAAAAACMGEPTGIHERRKRSAVGSLTTLANLMPACTPCNQWVEAEPEAAHAVGLVVRPGDHEWFLCGKGRNE